MEHSYSILKYLPQTKSAVVTVTDSLIDLNAAKELKFIMPSQIVSEVSGLATYKQILMFQDLCFG